MKKNVNKKIMQHEFRSTVKMSGIGPTKIIYPIMNRLLMNTNMEMIHIFIYIFSFTASVFYRTENSNASSCMTCGGTDKGRFSGNLVCFTKIDTDTAGKKLTIIPFPPKIHYGL